MNPDSCVAGVTAKVDGRKYEGMATVGVDEDEDSADDGQSGRF